MLDFGAVVRALHPSTASLCLTGALLTQFICPLDLVMGGRSLSRCWISPGLKACSPASAWDLQPGEVELS